MMRKLTALILSCVLLSSGSPVFATDSSAATDLPTATNLGSATNLPTGKSWGVSDLMHLLSQQKTRKASFVEKKYIAALQEPLEASGELSFTAPDRLEKRIIKPKPEAVVLDGDKLLIERRNGRKVTLSLSERPEVSGFVASIRATLVGDRSALEQFYGLDLEGSAAAWKLSLTPLQPQMLKIISEIRIAGSRDMVETIEFMQADGDRSVMTIKDEAAP